MNNTLKKTAGLLLALLMVTALLPQSIMVKVHGDDIVSKDNDDISYTLDSSGTLTIKADIDRDAANILSDSKAQISKVVIEEGVTAIGEEAFDHCTDLVEISLPSSLTYIGRAAFRGCTNLKEITIPENVTHIGGQAFAGCTSLKKATILGRVTRLEYNEFCGCNSMTEVTIPDSMMYIGITVFDECNSLTDVYYSCCQDDWDEIDIDEANVSLLNAKLHCTEYKSISRAEIRLPDLEMDKKGAYWTQYDGNAKKPDPAVTCKGSDLKKKTDYTVSYSNNKKAGIATVTVAGTGAFRGAVKKDFLITFKDVPPAHQYQKAVYWALDRGFVAGYSGDRTGTFGVGDYITRGQVILILWRYAGQPEADNLKSQTFSDVKIGSAYYKAVQWAAESGITSGFKDKTFRPYDHCTRGQIIQLLWRFYGEPDIYDQTTQRFTDVPTTHKYYKAVQWASIMGITSGYSDGSFGVNKTCTRGHCVTFLYRLLAQ